MPGKKTKEPKKGGGDEAQQKTPEDEEAERKEMMKHLEDIADALEKAKKVRNYFQTERDRINKFWDISKKNLECAKYELRNADVEIEEMEEKHQVEMKVYKQKVRHLLYEQKLQLQDVQDRSESQLQESEKSHEGSIVRLKMQKKELDTDHTKVQNIHVENVANQRMMYHTLIIGQRQDTELLINGMQQKYEEKLHLLRAELELRRRTEVHEIEERKNEHIKELVAKHQQAFQEIKEYYNDITSNNLDLIKSLKEEVDNMTKNENLNYKLMLEIATENKKLKEPLQKIEREVENLRQKLANYEKDKMSLKNAKSRLSVLESQYRQLEESHDKMKTEFSDTEQEKEELVAKFKDSLLQIDQHANRKNMILDEKLNKLKDDVRAKDAQLAGALQAANLEPVAIDRHIVTRKLEDMLETKNRAIIDLHFELTKVQNKHREVLKAYEHKCTANGLPPLDMKQLGLLKTYVVEG
eukprot:TRINITY_DN1810_c0_g4_i1.p1 TRINITY_DN1810_c0_g4~~TRINITY_DN1810_c0_g4_i1.p1  ORF type:complete len:469 (+),score=280.50 TRINITY_DN1810_c0_g4_i1:55-1461(+)